MPMPFLQTCIGQAHTHNQRPGSVYVTRCLEAVSPTHKSQETSGIGTSCVMLPNMYRPETQVPALSGLIYSTWCLEALSPTRKTCDSPSGMRSTPTGNKRNMQCLCHLATHVLTRNAHARNEMGSLISLGASKPSFLRPTPIRNMRSRRCSCHVIKPVLATHTGAGNAIDAFIPRSV